MVTAHINGKMLKWARDRAGFELDRLAKGNVTVKKLKAWEDGDAHPTQTQAIILRLRFATS